MRHRSPAVLCYLVVASLLYPAWTAAQGARVEIVQPPAWMEQATGKTALRSATVLPESAQIGTGQTGAVALLLGPHAQLGLGPQTELRLNRETTPAEGTRYALSMARGSARILVDPSGSTSDTWTLQAGTIRLEAAVADLWVQRAGARTTVCLMAGKVRASHPLTGEFSLEQAMSCLELPDDGMPSLVLPISRSEAIRRVTASAPQPNSGRMRDGGGWVIQLVSVSDADKAADLVRGLSEAGYPAETETSSANGRPVYRLRLDGFETRADAETVAARLTGRLGVGRPWVTCPNSPPCNP